MTNKEIYELDTTIDVDGVDVDATILFNYEPEEISFFSEITGYGCPGDNEHVEILNIAIEPQKGKVTQLCGLDLSLLLSDKDINNLKDEAIRYVKNKQREFDLEQQIANLSVS